MSDAIASYRALIEQSRRIGLLGSVGAILGWDERTQLPPRGTELRAQQMALIAGMVHAQFTSPRIGELLSAVEQSDLVRDPASDAAANVREIRREYDRARRVPGSLIEQISRTEVLGQQAWAAARGASDYRAFEPWLGKMLELKRQEARCYLDASPHDSPESAAGHDQPQTLYDALLEGFEPGERADNLRRVFAELRPALVELIARVRQSGRAAPVEILHRTYPAAAQQRLAQAAARAIGFDFQAGRLDVSVHPFCSGIGPGDVRLTTRYDEQYFGDAFFGVLHEAGHGLYEQGLPQQHFGTPLGQPVSLGIHESQSRMWENLVGRSRGFWAHFLPQARQVFGATLADVSEDQFYRAVNDIRPSLIRTEADEATYNLHILLRFELEQALLSGDLPTADLPGEWNRRMRADLGVDVPDDARGCLQDIHWSGGAIGYFPTYTLGNLYAAQFFQSAQRELGDASAAFARGQFAPLLAWLRTNIHQHGMRYRPRELVQRVTGRDLEARPLLDHLRATAQEVYGL